MLTEIYDNLSSAGIDLEQWHPEGATGQFEFVLPPLPPLAAVDTLIHAREIISTVVSSHGMRATLYPKPFPMQCGTASHVHISISSPKGEKKAVYEAFYAGILRSLRAIIAFTYSSPVSYDRMVDGCWAGGTWVTWGTQNRETPLRKVSGSHWEIKCLDGLANIYLAMAAIIAAGTASVANEEGMTWRDCQKDPADLSDLERKELGIQARLPKDLNQALKVLEKDFRLAEALGEEVVARYINVKVAEMKLLDGMDDHERTQWIIERY
jgi:glutamine synthetase